MSLFVLCRLLLVLFLFFVMRVSLTCLDLSLEYIRLISWQNLVLVITYSLIMTSFNITKVIQCSSVQNH